MVITGVWVVRVIVIRMAGVVMTVVGVCYQCGGWSDGWNRIDALPTSR